MKNILLGAMITLTGCAALPMAESEPSVSSTQSVATEIIRIAEDRGMQIALTAVHIETGERIEINADQRFPLASTYKVPIAAYALHLEDLGEVDLDQYVEVQAKDYVTSSLVLDQLPHPGVSLSLRNILEVTLTHSDNTATDLLLSAIGGGGNVTDWLRENGFKDIRVDRGTGDLLRDYLGLEKPDNPNIGFADQLAELRATGGIKIDQAFFDMANARIVEDDRDQGTTNGYAEFLAALWTGELLSAQSTAAIKTTLARCTTGAGRLSAGLPDEVLPLAHKTGTIGASVNDAGVITLPGDRGTVVLVVFVQDQPFLNLADYAQSEPMLADAAALVFEHFNSRSKDPQT